MKEEIKTIQKKVYKFNEKEKQKIIKKVLKNNKYRLETYYDYDDKLQEEQIIKIITEEDGLLDVENEIFEDGIEYGVEQEFQTIYNIIKEDLTPEEYTDEDLKEELAEVLESNWNYNINGLLKNSSAYLRADLNTNYEFMEMDSFKKTEYYKEIKKVFKGAFSIKDLDQEINSFIGSNCGLFTIFFNVSGNNILNLRKDFLKGKINLSSGLGCGFFNSWLGCCGYLELELKKPITLDLKNWTTNPKNKTYYNVSVVLDSKKYGIQETCGLVSGAWKEY